MLICILDNVPHQQPQSQDQQIQQSKSQDKSISQKKKPKKINMDKMEVDSDEENNMNKMEIDDIYDDPKDDEEDEDYITAMKARTASPNIPENNNEDAATGRILLCRY